MCGACHIHTDCPPSLCVGANGESPMQNTHRCCQETWGLVMVPGDQTATVPVHGQRAPCCCAHLPFDWPAEGETASVGGRGLLAHDVSAVCPERSWPCKCAAGNADCMGRKFKRDGRVIDVKILTSGRCSAGTVYRRWTSKIKEITKRQRWVEIIKPKP